MTYISPSLSCPLDRSGPSKDPHLLFGADLQIAVEGGRVINSWRSRQVEHLTRLGQHVLTQQSFQIEFEEVQQIDWPQALRRDS